MTGWGHTRSFGDVCSMSGLPPKADVGDEGRHFQLATTGLMHRSKKLRSLDHLVGEGAEHLRGPEVNHQLEFGRLTALAIPRSANPRRGVPFLLMTVKRLRLCCAHHFRLDRIIEHNPCLVHLWSKRGTKLLLQAPYQCFTKRNEMRFQYSKVRMLASYVADDGLEDFTFIERTNNRRDCVHQLELLSFHIVGEQTSCTGREFEESAVELLGEFSTKWPERVE
jgi:hypothetical protein